MLGQTILGSKSEFSGSILLVVAILVSKTHDHEIHLFSVSMIIVAYFMGQLDSGAVVLASTRCIKVRQNDEKYGILTLNVALWYNILHINLQIAQWIY